MKMLTIAIPEDDAALIEQLAADQHMTTEALVARFARRIAGNARAADAETLRRLVKREYSAPEIGALLGLTNSQVKHRLESLGLRARDGRTERPEGIPA